MSVSAQARAAELLSLLADETRLVLLAELVRRGESGATLTELSDALQRPLSKVGDACARLSSLGVAARDGDRFTARLANLRGTIRELDAAQPISPLLERYPRLKAVFSHGRLVSLPPVNGSGYLQLAEMLSEFLQLDGPVEEAEVNRRLTAVSDDFAKLRRMLVDTGWLVRDRAGRRYSPARNPIT